ncbi:pksN [Symbiodinium sp. CCMP2456]|nr:pksN [Symbiodinium sp. CCMP2456]
MASWLTLVPGDTFAVYYSDDNVYHERLALWRLQDGVWFILTPDGDLYPEDLRCAGGDGPIRAKVKDRDFKYWSRVGGPAYRFASRLTDDDFKQRIREAYRQGLQEPAFDNNWRPAEILNMEGVRVSSSDFLGGLLVTRRLAGKQSGLAPVTGPASPGGTGFAAPCLHSLAPITRASHGKVWIATESLEGVMRGQSVEVDVATDVQFGDHTGLVSRNGCWLKVELIDRSEIEEFRKERDLYPSVNELRSSDMPDVKVEQEQAEDDGDARTLYVDYDEQGHRYKPWRKVCQEATECNFSDAPHEGPSTVLFLIKQMERNGGSPKLWLDLWSRSRGIAETDRVRHELRTWIAWIVDVRAPSAAVHTGLIFDPLHALWQDTAGLSSTGTRSLSADISLLL